MLSKKQNPLQIRPGDRVEIHIDVIKSQKPFTATVTEVTDRTALGCDAGISYIPDVPDLDQEAAGISYGCSASYVTRIISRAQFVYRQEPKKNICREIINNKWEGWTPFTKGGHGVVYTHDIDGLIVYALAGLDRDIFAVDTDRIISRWTLDGSPGKVAVPSGTVYDEPKDFEVTAVHWRVFKKYIIRNCNRWLLNQNEVRRTTREMDEAAHLRHLDEDSRYREEVALDAFDEQQDDDRDLGWGY